MASTADWRCWPDIHWLHRRCFRRGKALLGAKWRHSHPSRESKRPLQPSQARWKMGRAFCSFKHVFVGDSWGIQWNYTIPGFLGILITSYNPELGVWWDGWVLLCIAAQSVWKRVAPHKSLLMAVLGTLHCRTTPNVPETWEGEDTWGTFAIVCLGRWVLKMFTAKTSEMSPVVTPCFHWLSRRGNFPLNNQWYQ